MFRKALILLLAATLAFGYFFFFQKSEELTHCPFCKEGLLEAQKFYEDDLVLAFVNRKPGLPGRCLITPKRHVERFENLSDEEITRIGQVIRQVDQAVSKTFNTSAYLILQKNGREAGQTVPHVHFHYIPRETGDSLVMLIAKMFISDIRTPLTADEMQMLTEKIKKNL